MPKQGLNFVEVLENVFYQCMYVCSMLNKTLMVENFGGLIGANNVFGGKNIGKLIEQVDHSKSLKFW